MIGTTSSFNCFETRRKIVSVDVSRTKFSTIRRTSGGSAGTSGREVGVGEESIVIFKGKVCRRGLSLETDEPIVKGRLCMI